MVILQFPKPVTSTSAFLIKEGNFQSLGQVAEAECLRKHQTPLVNIPKKNYYKNTKECNGGCESTRDIGNRIRISLHGILETIIFYRYPIAHEFLPCVGKKRKLYGEIATLN